MNTIPGSVAEILRDELFLAIAVTCNGDHFSSCVLCPDDDNLYSTIGTPVNMVFKEADTIIALPNSGIISCRNRFLSRVTSVCYGTVLTRIASIYHGHQIVSLVTTASARQLEVKTGDEVICMVKSTSMMLGTREGGAHD
jgi:molybdate transport system regulatory protein